MLVLWMPRVICCTASSVKRSRVLSPKLSWMVESEGKAYRCDGDGGGACFRK